MMSSALLRRELLQLMSCSSKTMQGTARNYPGCWKRCEEFVSRLFRYLHLFGELLCSLSYSREGDRFVRPSSHQIWNPFGKAHLKCGRSDDRTWPATIELTTTESHSHKKFRYQRPFFRVLQLPAAAQKIRRFVPARLKRHLNDFRSPRLGRPRSQRPVRGFSIRSHAGRARRVLSCRQSSACPRHDRPEFSGHNFGWWATRPRCATLTSLVANTSSRHGSTTRGSRRRW